MEVNSIKINLNCFEKSYFINEKYLQSITEDDDFKNIKTEYWKLNNINKFYFDKILKFEAWFCIE